MITPTVALVEVVWSLVAACGLVYSVALVRDALRDLAATRTLSPRNGRYRLARAAVRTEVLHAAITGGFLLVGALAMTLPGEAYTPARVAISVVLVTLVVALAVNSFLDRRLRKDLLR